MPASRACTMVLAISDSGIPKSRSMSWRYSVAPATAVRNASVCTAVPHIGCSSRGGPGRTTMVGPPGASEGGGTTSPGAVPTGSSTVAPSGTSACFLLDRRIASWSRSGQRLMSRSRIAQMRPSKATSKASGRRWNSPTTAAVRSSSVGPRPPLVTIRSTPAEASHPKASRTSCGRSPTTMLCATSTPTSRSRSASHGPLRSTTRPVKTSVPVTTMPARALIRSSAQKTRRPA
jgi:hypothetical protein